MTEKKRKGQPAPRYDEAFRQGAIRLVTEQNRTPQDVAGELGMMPSIPGICISIRIMSNGSAQMVNSSPDSKRCKSHPGYSFFTSRAICSRIGFSSSHSAMRMFIILLLLYYYSLWGGHIETILRQIGCIWRAIPHELSPNWYSGLTGPFPAPYNAS